MRWINVTLARIGERWPGACDQSDQRHRAKPGLGQHGDLFSWDEEGQSINAASILSRHAAECRA